MLGWRLSVLNCKIMSMISQFYRKSMGMSWHRSTRVSQENISKTMLRQIGLGIIAWNLRVNKTMLSWKIKVNAILKKKNILISLTRPVFYFSNFSMLQCPWYLQNIKIISDKFALYDNLRILNSCFFERVNSIHEHHGRGCKYLKRNLEKSEMRKELETKLCSYFLRT